MAKPSDFYIGILTFFAILLPGAVAAAIFKSSFRPRHFSPSFRFPPTTLQLGLPSLLLRTFLGI
jgi:hypothetical protein